MYCRRNLKIREWKIANSELSKTLMHDLLAKANCLEIWYKTVYIFVQNVVCFFFFYRSLKIRKV